MLSFDSLGDAPRPRSMGSAALNMCHVAQGGVDGYYEIGIHAWDVAAGQLLVEEAGGVVTDMTGEWTWWPCLGGMHCIGFFPVLLFKFSPNSECNPYLNINLKWPFNDKLTVHAVT